MIASPSARDAVSEASRCPEISRLAGDRLRAAHLTPGVKRRYAWVYADSYGMSIGPVGETQSC